MERDRLRSRIKTIDLGAFSQEALRRILYFCNTHYSQECNDYPQEYGAPQKTVCRTWFESECNTTYVEAGSGDLKPNTWCQKMPRKICAPDNCNMVQVGRSTL